MLTAQLIKVTVEAALSAELGHHLRYTHCEYKGHHTGNSRNGYSSTLKGDYGLIEIETLRDPNASFDPQIFFSKGQAPITGSGDEVLTLYAKGMSTCDISSAFEEQLTPYL